jgi:hypothetical protein
MMPPKAKTESTLSIIPLLFVIAIEPIKLMLDCAARERLLTRSHR